MNSRFIFRICLIALAFSLSYSYVNITNCEAQQSNGNINWAGYLNEIYEIGEIAWNSEIIPMADQWGNITEHQPINLDDSFKLLNRVHNGADPGEGEIAGCSVTCGSYDDCFLGKTAWLVSSSECEAFICNSYLLTLQSELPIVRKASIGAKVMHEFYHSLDENANSGFEIAENVDEMYYYAFSRYFGNTESGPLEFNQILGWKCYDDEYCQTDCPETPHCCKEPSCGATQDENKNLIAKCVP